MLQVATPVSLDDIADTTPSISQTLAIHRQAVERAIQTMHTHLHELLTLEDLAAVAYLSPYHFNRVFRRLTGIPPVEFLAALRFQAARRLLLSTTLSVTDICFAVGYTSTGSFTSRFTQLVGLPPRLLRQRAYAFAPLPVRQMEDNVFDGSMLSSVQVMRHTLMGYVAAPASFRGTIYIGLFTSPVPQGVPVRCAKLSSSGFYRLSGVADGVYYLRAAAFPDASDLQSYVLPGQKLLLGNNLSPVVMHNGLASGDADLVLHAPRLTDPPLVMGLPFLPFRWT